MSDNLKEWIKDIGIAIIAAVIILQFIKPSIVQQTSMNDTLRSGDYLIVSKQSYKLFGGDPQHGDIIIFKTDLETDTGKKKMLVKRVIGVPGDTIRIEDGYVYRNGELLEEDYTRDGYTGGHMDEVLVPEGSYFCMGDNRQNSVDSRSASIGFVDRDLILGKVVIRLFPFNRIKTF